jgi:hypothetical protein
MNKFFIELIMLREDQKELKMNMVTKFPTKVTDMIKTKYKKYIEDCYKKNNNNFMKQNKSYHKQHHQKQKQHYKHKKKHQMKQHKQY